MDDKKQTLKQAFDSFLETASDKSLDALAAFLEGANLYDQNVAKTYINGILNYKGNLLSDTEYEARINLTPFTENTLNITHGGILATFADTAMGSHVFQLLPEDLASVTTEMTIHFLKPALGHYLVAKSEILKRGTHLCVMSCKIYNDEGTLVCSSTASFYIIKRRPMAHIQKK